MTTVRRCRGQYGRVYWEWVNGTDGIAGFKSADGAMASAWRNYPKVGVLVSLRQL